MKYRGVEYSEDRQLAGEEKQGGRSRNARLRGVSGWRLKRHEFADAPSKRRFEQLADSWRVMVETQDWLDGKMPTDSLAEK
jgi:hypothetical protein